MKNTLALVVILLGAVFLATNLGLFSLRWDIIWPVIIIAIGIGLLRRRGDRI